VTPLRDEGVCADLHVGSGAPVGSVTVLAAADAGAGRAPTPVPGCAVADRTADLVAVRPGRGALVRALSGAGTGSTEYLVTDAGVRYPLPSAGAVKQLGYGGSSPVAVPSGVLGLLPTGPVLDPSGLVGDAAASAPAGRASSPTCG
ncbi:type VII secretion protein EccB, partial [Kitasatospora sp. NPDC093558]|uniref:type VII secretion protein EccB n=1 Tax=Kitasatospora sp. NPDC093558 TaxID=3155201 RepID=UPI00341A095E